jgi:hypothetical protein
MVLWEILKERGNLKEPNVDVRIILEWIFEMWDGVCTGSIWFSIG